MDVETMPKDAEIRELVKRLSAFAYDYPCIHCGSPILEINSRRQVICPRCLGENPMDVKNEVVLEAADTITALQAENERLKAERDELRQYAHAATKAITGLTPGGSEYFGRIISGIYTADLEVCTAVIRDRFERTARHLRAALKGSDQ